MISGAPCSIGSAIQTQLPSDTMDARWSLRLREEMAVSLALMIAMLSTACGHSNQLRGDPSSHRQPGTSMIEHYCLDCHSDPTNGRPDLSASLEPDVARSALRAVLSRQMPPPALPQPDQRSREELVTWLCVQAGRGAAACQKLAAAESERRYIRTATTLLHRIRRDIAPGPFKLEGALAQHSRPSSPSAELDITTVALLLALAREACAMPQSSVAAQQRCWDHIVDLGVAPLPAPAP
jgi:hypothetical protein